MDVLMRSGRIVCLQDAARVVICGAFVEFFAKGKRTPLARFERDALAGWWKSAENVTVFPANESL